LDGAAAAGETTFKRLLLNQCQESYTASRVPMPASKLEGLPEEERLEAYLKHKEIVLGCTKLIGELLRRRMIAPKILSSIMDDLLGDSSDESVEILCVLLRVVCPSLTQIFQSTPDTPTQLLARLKPLTSDMKLVKRTRFIVQDVLDAWEKQWRWERDPRQAPRTVTSSRETSWVHGAPAVRNVQRGGTNPRSVVLRVGATEIRR